MAFAAWLTSSQRSRHISWSFLSVLLSTQVTTAFPHLGTPINTRRNTDIRFPISKSRLVDDLGLSASKLPEETKSDKSAPRPIHIDKFPNAALDKSLTPDTIGDSGISKSVPAQIHFPAPESKASAKALSELLTPDTIGNSGIGKSIPVQIHFPDPEVKASAETLPIPDFLAQGGTGFSASLTPDTIGNSGISKSIPVQIHFPAPEGKVIAKALNEQLTPDTIGNSGIGKSIPIQIHFPDPEVKVSGEALLIPDSLAQGGTGFSASLTPDTIGNSGISKSIPVQIHFPAPEGKVIAKALNKQLTPDTIGNSGIGKSIPIQLHFPSAESEASAEPLDALLIPDTIGNSGISKQIPAERQRFPAQTFSRLLQVPAPDVRKLGPGKLARRSHSTVSSSRADTSGSSSSTTSEKESRIITMSAPSMNTWLGRKASAMSQCILPLSFDSHKGSSGRVGVLGGSAQYTGAPYYAAMASLKAGADLAYVFCAQEACLPIKSYSPELMVAPVYNAAGFDALADDYEENDKTKKQIIDRMVQEVTSKMERLHVLVVGPGMGRCPLVCEATARIIEHAKKKKLALVLDADALWMLAQPEYHNLFEGYNDAPVVLTPNVVEYKRLKDSLSASQLESTTIVRKGPYDVIVQHGKETLECHEVGGKKRSGGIGDVLAGTIGTLLSWKRILQKEDAASDDVLALSCWAACCFVKHATLLAFNDKKRSMTAPDVLEHLGPAINEMTDEEAVACPAMSNL